MNEHRMTGHNVLHLLYPIKKQKGSKCNELDQLLIKENFKPFFEKEHIFSVDAATEHKQNIASVYSSTLKSNEEFARDTLRYWVPEKQIMEYFHPTVQRSLFQSNNFKKFRKIEGKVLSADLLNYDYKKKDWIVSTSFAFQWLASEVYIFDNEHAFLVVRLSLLENVSVEIENHELKLIQHDKPIQPLNVWMKFANRIRKNYPKYEKQERLSITREFNRDFFIQRTFEEERRSFIEYVENYYLSIFQEYAISNVNLHSNSHDIKPSQRMEPNSFVYAFVQSDLSQPLTNRELYQLAHIDDYDGESGGTEDFIDEFVDAHLYKRWVSSKTYTTAIDYGAMTITHNTNYIYSNSSSIANEAVYPEFPDLMIQHYSRIYLLFIVLQLFYREQIQDLLGRYASLEDLKKKEEQKKAKEILKDYYQLNQYYFFKRISQEIQGIEMWKFYYETFGIDELYLSVVHDMHELNQRLIERHSEVQGKEIYNLTILAAFTGLFGMNLIIPLFEGDAWINFLGEYPGISNILSIFFNVIAIGLILYILFLYLPKIVKRKY